MEQRWASQEVPQMGHRWEPLLAVRWAQRSEPESAVQLAWLLELPSWGMQSKPAGALPSEVGSGHPWAPELRAPRSERLWERQLSLEHQWEQQ